MRGLKKTSPDGAHTHRHTDGHGNSMTNFAQWGRLGEKKLLCKLGRLGLGIEKIRRAYTQYPLIPNFVKLVSLLISPRSSAKSENPEGFWETV